MLSNLIYQRYKSVLKNMKIRLCLFVSLLLFSTGISNAQTLYGFVKELNSQNTPVKNVMVKGNCANQVETTDNGQFTLQFQVGKPGKSVQLFADKEGWVVTDKTKLTPNLPEDPLHNPHVVIVCPKEKWKKLLDESLEVCEKGMRASYEKRVAELNGEISGLNKENKSYQTVEDSLYKEIDRLNQQYKEQQKNALKFAEEHSKQNLDEITELEKKAYQLFSEGKIEESLALRESMKSIENIEKRNVEIKSLQQTIENNLAANEIDRRNLKQQAKEAQLLFKWDKAETALEYLARDTTDYEAMIEYGSLLIIKNEIDKSQKYFKLIFSNSKQIEANQKNILEQWNIKLDDYEIPEGMMQYDPALVFCIFNSINLSEEGKFEIQEWFNLYESMNKYQIENLYHILIEEKVRLNRIDHESNKRELSLNDFSNNVLLNKLLFYFKCYHSNCLNDTLLKNEEIDNLYEKFTSNNMEINDDEAISTSIIITKYLSNKIEYYSKYLCDLYTNLGELYYNKKEYLEVEKAYLLALEASRINSDSARILYYLGILYDDKHDFASAEKYYKEALIIYRQCAESAPNLYNSALGRCLGKLSELYSKTDNISNSLLVKLEECEIRKKVSSKSSEDYYNYGSCLGNIAWYYILLKKPKNAEKAAREALNPEIGNKPEDYDTKIEWVNTNLTLSLLLQGKFEISKDIYLKYKDKPVWEHTFKYYFLKDIDDLENKGITHPDMKKIKDILSE
jgi:hypothetical protein